MPRDHPRHGRRAVHAGEDADVVARRDAAVSPDDSQKCFLLREKLSGAGKSAISVVALEVAHRHVVHVHVIASRDRLRGEADDLVVAVHRLALLDRPHRDLVAGRNAHRGAHVLFGEHRSGGNLDARDDDVVLGMQADGQVGGLQHGIPPKKRLGSQRTISGT